MTKVTCSVPECERPSRKRGWCTKHYARWLKYRSTDLPVRVLAGSTVCAAPGCDRAGKVRGWCQMHYARFVKTGDPLGLKPPNGGARPVYGPPAPCAVPGCTGNRKARGFCHKHWQKFTKYGDPLGEAIPVVTDFDDGTRSCLVCALRLPLDQFDRDSAATGGRRAQCKSCRGAKVAAWYAANRERQRERADTRRAADPDRYREQDRARYYRDKPKRLALVTEYGNRRRAILANAPSVKGITKLRLRKIHGDPCCYCGCTMQFVDAKGREFIPDQASIEHIIPLSAGGTHTWENVALACRSCNTRKNAKTPEQWERHKEIQRARAANGLGDAPDLDATA